MTTKDYKEAARELKEFNREMVIFNYKHGMPMNMVDEIRAIQYENEKIFEPLYQQLFYAALFNDMAKRIEKARSNS